MDIQQINALNLKSLKAKLNELGLATTGLNADLQNRLVEHFGLAVGNSDSEYDDESSRRAVSPVRERGVCLL